MTHLDKRKNIYLVGFMGAGKSTIGKILSERLNIDYFDLDKEIEKAENREIKMIFEQNGEEYFRILETSTLNHLSSSNKNFIISTGGGVIEREENRGIMSRFGKTLYLKADINTLWERVRHSKHRPLLNVDNAFVKAKELFNKRKDLYEKSDYVVETDNLNKEQVADEILKIID
ncbi:MAG: AAA family ATPase [Candidatus Dadabacteria bacterium]|nr:AAA family ATPase [Candidatus Dadabacteria bacterium]NIQ13429.1 AAA family ATPase [Candidatus Dadabacteria bacterium]